MKLWTDPEWFFCLSCFYRSADIVLALFNFNSRYPERSKDAIRRKFHRERINLYTYLGSGLKNKATKQEIIKELKHVYESLGQPYTRKQFDEVSKIPSSVIIGHFGDWESSLEQAALQKKFNSHRQITQQIKTFDPEKELKEQWAKEKQQILQRAEQKKVKQVKQQENKFELINEMIVNAVASATPPIVNVNPTRAIAPSKDKEGHVTLWFEFSDLQLGTLITAEEMGGINEHNWAIWQTKLAIWKNTAIKKIDFYLNHYNIDHVIIAGLGDFVEGINIFKGQEWKVDAHCVDQAIYGANDTAAAFIEIMLTFPTISFRILEVFGNHGRIGSKGEHPYSCSMDKVFLRMLETQIHAARVTNYIWCRNDAWFYLASLYGWNHLLLHGDQGMGGLWSNRPTINGLEKGVVRWSQMLQQQVHFVHIGHFHQEAALSFNRSSILINGSFIGTSDFAAKVMVASSPPIQVMHVFEPDIGLSKTERIYLTELKDNDAIKAINPSIVL